MEDEKEKTASQDDKEEERVTGETWLRVNKRKEKTMPCRL